MRRCSAIRIRTPGLRPDPSPRPSPNQVLGVLERLGMRSRVTRSAVLQSARSIEELAASDAPAAARRARALLRYVDRNAEAIPADPSPPLPLSTRPKLSL